MAVFSDRSITITVSGNPAGYSYWQASGPIQTSPTFPKDVNGNSWQSGITYLFFATHPDLAPDPRLIRIYFTEDGIQSVIREETELSAGAVDLDDVSLRTNLDTPTTVSDGVMMSVATSVGRVLRRMTPPLFKNWLKLKLSEVTAQGNETPDAIKAEAFLRKNVPTLPSGNGLYAVQVVVDEFGQTYYAESLQEWANTAQVLAEQIQEQALKILFNKLSIYANDGDLITIANRLRDLGQLDGTGSGSGSGGCSTKAEALLYIQQFKHEMGWIDDATGQVFPEPVYPDCTPTTPGGGGGGGSLCMTDELALLIDQFIANHRGWYDGDTIPSKPVWPDCTPTTAPTLTLGAHFIQVTATGAVYVGALDEATCQIVRGWVFNQDDHSQRVSVDIYINGQLAGTAPTYRPRDDVAQAYGITESNLLEFYFTTPASFAGSGSLEYSIVVAGTLIPLSGSPATVANCAPSSGQSGTPYVSGLTSVVEGGPGAKQTILLRQPSGPDVAFTAPVTTSTVGGVPGVGFDGGTLVFLAGENTLSQDIDVETHYSFVLNGQDYVLIKVIKAINGACARPTSGLETVTLVWNFTAAGAGQAVELTYPNADRIIVQKYNNQEPGTLGGAFTAQIDPATGDVFLGLGTSCQKVDPRVYYELDAGGNNTRNLIIDVVGGKIVRSKTPNYTPAQPTQIVGQMDRANCTEVVGWGFNQANPGEVRTFSVMVDGVAVHEVSSGVNRPDVAQAVGVPSAANCGIVFTVPATSPIKNGQAHQVGLREIATGYDLPGGPIRVQCGSLQPPGTENCVNYRKYPSNERQGMAPVTIYEYKLENTASNGGTARAFVSQSETTTQIQLLPSSVSRANFDFVRSTGAGVNVGDTLIGGNTAVDSDFYAWPVEAGYWAYMPQYANGETNSPTGYTLLRTDVCGKITQKTLITF